MTANPIMSAVRTSLLASVAAVSALAGLGDRPAQAANYGPLPLLSADQITDDSTCYMEDANGVIVDLSWICDGGQGHVLPAIAVKNVSKPQKKVTTTVIKPGLTVNVIKAPTMTAPNCTTNPEFSSCEPPVIEITGGSTLEAMQELNAAPTNPYEGLGIY